MTVSVRPLSEWDDFVAAVRVVLAVWGDDAVGLASPALLRTYVHYGEPVIGAFDGEQLCGVSIGFLASIPEVHLHSHITGVVPSHQHLGVGFRLKHAQRQWCVDNGIRLMTWTFDPMLARNAHFNLRKLGAVARRLMPNFYGAMDDDFNRGDETDRLEITWRVVSDASCAVPRPIVQSVAIPPDYLALRADDPAKASECRVDVRDQLLCAFADGLEVVDFAPDEGYLLAPRCAD